MEAPSASIAEKEDFDYADVDHLGKYTEDNTFNKRHIDSARKATALPQEPVHLVLVNNLLEPGNQEAFKPLPSDCWKARKEPL